MQKYLKERKKETKSIQPLIQEFRKNLEAAQI